MLYGGGSWQEALDCLLPLAEQFQDDGIIAIDVDLCRNYLANDLDPDWNGTVRVAS